MISGVCISVECQFVLLALAWPHILKISLPRVG
jgi:hypothetical protein